MARSRSRTPDPETVIAAPDKPAPKVAPVAAPATPVTLTVTLSLAGPRGSVLEQRTPAGAAGEHAKALDKAGIKHSR